MLGDQVNSLQESERRVLPRTPLVTLHWVESPGRAAVTHRVPAGAGRGAAETIGTKAAVGVLAPVEIRLNMGTEVGTEAMVKPVKRPVSLYPSLRQVRAVREGSRKAVDSGECVCVVQYVRESVAKDRD